MNRTDELLWRSRRFQVVRTHYPLDENTTETREVVRHVGAVAILPLVNERQVCLIRNFRVSIGQTLLELPAGTLEDNELPRLCAERELAEETGYHAASLREVHAFYPSPGILDERMHLFLAEGLTPGNPSRELSEHIENHILDWEDALQLADRGEIQDAKTLVGLFFYDRVLRRNLAKGDRRP